MPRMRTIPEAIRELREQDPRCCLTPHALRALLLNGVVPSVRIGEQAPRGRGTGGKILVDLDRLERFLSGEQLKEAETE